MKKKLLIALMIIFIISLLMIIGWQLYVEEGTIYESFGFFVPLLTKRETITLKYGDFFDNEEMKKIYLSKGQAKRILERIEQDDAWINGEIDNRLEERLNFYTREKIYNQIPYIKNKYWIFTNRSNGVKDKHSINEVIDDIYYAVSFGIFDLDNNILYYYEYDR